MGVSFILLTLFTIFHLLRTLRKSAFSKLLLFRIIGLDIILFVLIILAGKAETDFYLAGLSLLNKKIFMLFSSLTISNYMLFRMLNTGVFLFSVSIPMIIRPFLVSGRRIVSFNTYMIWLIIGICFVLFIYCNDPRVLYLVYLRYIQQDPLVTDLAVRVMFHLQRILFMFVLFVYPLVTLTLSRRGEKLVIKKKQILVVLSNLLIMNAFVFLFLDNNGFSYFQVVFNRATTLAPLSMAKLPPYYQNTIPLLLILSTEVFLIYLNFSQIMTPTDLLEKKIILRNSVNLRKNLGGLFHIFKNNYFNLYCQTVKIREELPEQHEALDKMIDEIEQMQQDLNKLISSVVDIKLSIQPQQVSTILKKAVQGGPQHDGIRLSLAIEGEIWILGDEIYLVEALRNLIKNSMESIIQDRGAAGEITIQAARDKAFAVITVSDTGGGIPAKIRRKVLQPQFSTKVQRQNWGLGLTFSYRVIKMHLGYMDIVSEEGVGTKIEILLPVYDGGKR